MMWRMVEVFWFVVECDRGEFWRYCYFRGVAGGSIARGREVGGRFVVDRGVYECLVCVVVCDCV